MQSQAIRANFLLFLAAAIWGLAFVAQRVGVEFVGPFTFNGVRFALGSLSLVPLLLYYKNSRSAAEAGTPEQQSASALKPGLLAGVFLFIAASLQQVGLVYTTAGKAAFITSLYIVLVPLLGIFLKQYIGISTWLGALFAAWGVYLLSVTDQFLMSYGDFLVLIGGLFWAFHILLIDYYSRRVAALTLAFIQFVTCSLLSLITAFMTETFSLTGLWQAAIPILYGGIGSVGIAYTLQIVGQKDAKPSHAAIILSMETVFAALGGWLILNEEIGTRGLIGCALMFVGMLLSQIQGEKSAPSQPAQE